MKHKFDISEASNKKTKKKIFQFVGDQWRQFKSNLTSKWALVEGKDNEDETVCDKYDINKDK